jgi:predicted DNA-binding transcriptional regulator AlpA
MSDSDPANTFLPDPKVRVRYGVTDMTLWRWSKDPNLKFPQPMKINGRNYRRLAELETWERKRARASRSAA